MSRPLVLREVVLGDVLELVQAMRDLSTRWSEHAKSNAERERFIGALAMLRFVSSAAAILAARPTIDEDQEQRAVTLREIARLAVAQRGEPSGEEESA